MTNGTAQPDNTEPDATEPVATDTGTAGAATKHPTGVDGGNPALDDTGNLKAAEVGKHAEQPEDPQNLDLTPEGLADEPAKQEDPDSLAAPENS
ncbi:hypothetical protein SRABI83_03004 [Arthrobacter sp. Bi83]|uniref:hypothetical protein n=1 Tax=Arthrobacter sp. Bi83 TaxID=2822353 RepID=UPI001D8A0591|nr:hypothetical protein [Arthrobacter sp. Bi83]CAH0246181.1 hypothetical protein SRABI83_03004 [Arthrobacter sp. Bi83]